MFKNLTFSILISFFFIFSLTAQDNPLVRTPSLNSDGSKVSFSYQGDIWTVPSTGGIARRLTIHESYESNPQWSPDGNQIVFQGNRFGNDDLYLMDASGSMPQRLTYHSGSDGDPRWGNNGQIYFTSRKAFAQVEREQEVHSISKNGGTPRRTLNAVALMPAPSPDGKFIALVRGSCRVSRETYKGPANRNIWIYNNKSESYFQITEFEGQDIYPDWGGGELYYLSARNGRYNIFKQLLNEKGAAQGAAVALTKFRDEGIRYFDVSADGSKIVFERGTGVYVMDAQAGARPKPLNIQVTGDYRFDPVEHKSFSRNASDFSISPDEKQMAFEVRGELFLKQNDKEKKRSIQLTKHPYRDKEPVWVNDSTLLFVSDRNGNFDLFVMQSSDPKESNLFKTFKRGIKQLTTSTDEEEGVVISSDHKKIAYRRGRGKLVVADIAPDGTLSNELILVDGWDTPGRVSWSPDSRWLAYSLDDLTFNQEIYIHAADGSQPAVNVSLHPRGDSSPKWSEDGSKLGFISTRNNGDSDVWFVWLRKADWEKTQRDWEEAEDEQPEKSKKKKESKDVQSIEIDFEDIHERIEQVTRLAGNERNLMISKDGESFYFTTNGGGRQGSPGEPDLMSVKWDGSEMKKIASKSNLSRLKMEKAGKNLYAIKSGGTFTKINVAGGKQETHGFQAKMDVDHKAERKQIFEEAWRRLRDGFYDPNFHGQDWNQLKTRYFDRCMNASTDRDFRFYYNEMLGQLNASHMGLRSGDPEEETQRERTGLLGVEVIPDAGGVKIITVIPNTPADRSESKLNVGDIIRSVDGEPISPTTNFYSLLIDKANERVLLEVVNFNGEQREVIIRPTNSIRSDLYYAWVKERKRLTEKYSNGRLGYIHIQGMNWTSFERFERELAASGLGKEGIVIDVRFNGGGWTTDMLMAVLNVRQHSYTIPRGAAENLEKENQKFRQYYPFGERLPLSSWTKPSIALCNENSYSNAEIFSHAYQSLGLGTLVGMPTFGAVISTGSSRLLDGSSVRMPYRAWYVKSTGKNMEWGPAVPDIQVKNAPDSKSKGEDPQLKRAVDELLKTEGSR